MVDWVNPGILGSIYEFKKKFISPICAGQIRACSEEDSAVSRTVSAALNSITDPFILRRTADTNSAYLTGKTELILFCPMTQHQQAAYQSALSACKMENALVEIGNMKKIANFPSSSSSEANQGSIISQDCFGSAKLGVAMQIIERVSSANEKVVLVSHSTKSLNFFQVLLASKGHSFLRLDGSVPSQKRQELVDRFSRNDSILVFLLSSKAGGVGLNLVAASRLIMFDIDWNPAVDQQAMARIWRDGQKKPVFIYRLIRFDVR